MEHTVRGTTGTARSVGALLPAARVKLPRRLVACVLAVVLSLGLMPAAAQADDAANTAPPSADASALASVSAAAAASTGQLIRVGYFAFDGYHNMDDQGNRSGYGYEYLQQMARYTGWTYDYVGYDASWGEAQDMLEAGQIDLLTSAQKTAAREEIFDFSDDPIGYSSTIFTIKAGNNAYTIDDFSTFNGIHVGMIEGNSRNAEFDSFAKQKGFTYESVMFESTDALVAALQDGSIDAVVTSSLRATSNEWIVSEFGFSPYYVCVKKGNQELLAQVNEAIGKIN